MTSDALTDAASIATVGGTVIALGAAVASAVSARASKRDAKESRRALALHFPPQLMLEVSDKSLGRSDHAVRLDLARQAQVGQNLQIMLRHMGGAHALKNDEVKVRWITIDGRPHDEVLIVPLQLVRRGQGSLLELGGLPITGHTQEGNAQVASLRRLELRTRDAQTGSEWLCIYNYNDTIGFYDGAAMDFVLETVH